MGLWSSIGGGIGSAIGSIWGPAGAAIGQKAGQDMGQVGDWFQNRHDARDAASRANGYMLYMQNTAHQREVLDLIAAGLNPVLSGMGGTGAGFGSVPVNSAYNRDYNHAAEAEGYASARRIREQNEREKELNNAQVDLLKSQEEQVKASVDKSRVEEQLERLELLKKLRENKGVLNDDITVSWLRSFGFNDSMILGATDVLEKSKEGYNGLLNVIRDKWNSRSSSDAKDIEIIYKPKKKILSPEDSADKFEFFLNSAKPKVYFDYPRSDKEKYKKFGHDLLRDSMFKKSWR